MSITSVIKATDVKDYKAYAAYVQQTCGTPYCTQQDFMVLNKAIKEFKDRYPHLADNPWPTLCRAAQWCRSKRKRPSKVFVVVKHMVAWAWQEGALPELDPTRYRDEVVETGIENALQECTDPVWRDRLIGAEGPGRKGVLDAWMQRSSLSQAR